MSYTDHQIGRIIEYLEKTGGLGNTLIVVISDRGQGDLPDNGRPAGEGRPLRAKKEEHAAKEAFDATALAQFLFGPGGG
jgi:arylsulfatase A-like enzyme